MLPNVEHITLFMMTGAECVFLFPLTKAQSMWTRSTHVEQSIPTLFGMEECRRNGTKRACARTGFSCAEGGPRLKRYSLVWALSVWIYTAVL